MQKLHPDDPTTEPHEFRIYADDMAQTWAVVDQVDYQWAIQWRWHINKPHPLRNGTKQYFVRSNSSGGDYRGPKFYLHVEIQKRKGIPPPDPEHKLVEHLDDDEWNCRRANLEWITPKKNRMSSKKAAEAWDRLQKKQGRRT